MKKIINGKLYNTETAIIKGEWCHGSGFNRIEETLYRKRTGEYFLHGEGGPMTRYAEYVSQNCWGWGESIIPLAEGDARIWAEEHLDADEYINIFGNVEE